MHSVHMASKRSGLIRRGRIGAAQCVACSLRRSAVCLALMLHARFVCALFSALRIRCALSTSHSSGPTHLALRHAHRTLPLRNVHFTTAHNDAFRNDAFRSALRTHAACALDPTLSSPWARRTHCADLIELSMRTAHLIELSARNVIDILHYIHRQTSPLHSRPGSWTSRLSCTRRLSL